MRICKEPHSIETCSRTGILKIIRLTKKENPANRNLPKPVGTKKHCWTLDGNGIKIISPKFTVKTYC